MCLSLCHVDSVYFALSIALVMEPDVLSAVGNIDSLSKAGNETKFCICQDN